MAYWLLKTEPEEYSIGDLQREGRCVWDGVTNNLALRHMRTMKRGDQALVYHTGNTREIVGLVNVVSDPYPDPDRNDTRIVVVDLEYRSHLPKRVTLGDVRADPAFRGFDLVRLPRLSVMPVPPKVWWKLLRMAGMKVSGEGQDIPARGGRGRATRS